MTPPKVNPSPKSRFLNIKHCIDAHRELLQRQDLITGMDQAMLEYQWHLCGGDRVGTLTVNAGEAAANYYKLLGAHEFLRTFRNLSEVQLAPPAQDRTGELDHQFK